MAENNNSSRKPVDILTNRFKINVNGPGEGALGVTEFTLHQYRVEFDDKNATCEMKNAALNEYQDGVIRDAFLFDGGSQVHCTHLFNPPGMRPPTQEGANGGPSPKKDQIPRKLTLTYIQALPQDDPMYTQVYNLIIEKCMQGMGMHPLGDNFYGSEDADTDFPNLKLKLRPGFKASVTRDGKCLILEVDVIQNVIHSENLLSMIQKMKAEHGKGTIRKPLEEFIRNMLMDLLSTIDTLNMEHGKGTIGDSLDELVGEKLKGSMVISSHDKNSYTIATIRMDLTPKSKIHPDDKKSITYNHYYKEAHKVHIKDKTQPLIIPQIPVKSAKGKDGGQIDTLVPELLNLTGLGEKIRNDASIMEELQNHLYMNPAKRMEIIQTFIKKMSSSDAVKNCGLSIDCSIMPCMKGEGLPKEVMVFGNGKTVPVDLMNDWTKHATENQMLVSVPLEKWILVTGERDHSQATDFVYAMRKVGGTLGLRIDPPLAVERLMDVRYVNYVRTLEELIGPGCKYHNVQLVVCVLPNEGSVLYNMIKNRLTTEYGILSQCITAESLDKNAMSATAKLLIQLNAKLGGEPWKVRLPHEMRDENTMVVGLDFSQKIGRTGVVVATINQDMTRYHSESFQFSELQQIQSALIKAIGNSIKSYCEMQKTTKPPSFVLLYRNNVDDEKIISGEVETDANALQKALDKLYQEKYGSGVKLVYITVARRCSTRIMSHVGHCDEDEVNVVPASQVVNPAPGTVVKKITEGKYKNYSGFFLVPTAAREGTVQATHCRVILDNKGISLDVIEALTYKLCHLYFNCTGTVDLPSVCQYAEKLMKVTAETIHGDNANRKLRSLLHYL